MFGVLSWLENLEPKQCAFSEDPDAGVLPACEFPEQRLDSELWPWKDL